MNIVYIFSDRNEGFRSTLSLHKANYDTSEAILDLSKHLQYTVELAMSYSSRNWRLERSPGAGRVSPS